MTRNIFRKQKQAFDYDPIAMSVVSQISDEEFSSYAILEQMFLLLPFEHDENNESQERCIHLTNLLVKNAEKQEGISQELLKITN